MSATTSTPPARPSDPASLSAPGPTVALMPHGVARKVSDIATLTVRNLVHISREPMQLSDVTVQPVLFTLMFVAVLGGGVVLPDNASYTDFAVPGLLVLNLVTITVGTGIGLCTDVTSGVVDRFGTLPMWRPAILIARSVTDLATAVICAAIVAATGFAIGWSPDNGVVAAIAAFALVLLFGYAVSWMCACLGLVSDGVESTNAFGLMVLFPLVFVSNALVPTEGMTPWLRDVTTWNPMSAVSAAARELFGNPNPSSTIDVWQMQHPVAATLVWSAGLLCVFVPLAVVLYRRRTAD